MTHAKLLGHCAQCNVMCWDPHAYPVQPRSTWTGLRAHFMLSDGSLMPLTLCEACATEPDYELIWEVVMSGWLSEPARPDEAPDIRDDYGLTQHARGTFILDLFYTEKWTEIEA